MCVCGLKLAVKVPTNSLGKDFPCGFTALSMLQFWKEDVFRWSSHSLHSFPRLNDSYKVFCYLVFLNFFVILTYCCVINALQLRDLKYCYSVTKSCLTLQPHGLQHTRLLCPSLSPGVCSNSYSFSWRCHPTISSLAALFCSQSSQHQGLSQ